MTLLSVNLMACAAETNRSLGKSFWRTAWPVNRARLLPRSVMPICWRTTNITRCGLQYQTSFSAEGKGLSERDDKFRRRHHVHWLQYGDTIALYVPKRHCAYKDAEKVGEYKGRFH